MKTNNVILKTDSVNAIICDTFNGVIDNNNFTPAYRIEDAMRLHFDDSKESILVNGTIEDLNNTKTIAGETFIEVRTYNDYPVYGTMLIDARRIVSIEKLKMFSVIWFVGFDYESSKVNVPIYETRYLTTEGARYTITGNEKIFFSGYIDSDAAL